MEQKKLEPKTILIDERKYKNFVIYYTTYTHCKSMKIITLHYNELIRKIEDHEGKKYLMFGDLILGKVLEKIKEIIGTKKADSTNIDRND